MWRPGAPYTSRSCIWPVRPALYLVRAEHNTSHAFATVESVQMVLVALLAIGAAALPRFTDRRAQR